MAAVRAAGRFLCFRSEGPTEEEKSDSCQGKPEDEWLDTIKCQEPIVQSVSDTLSSPLYLRDTLSSPDIPRQKKTPGQTVPLPTLESPRPSRRMVVVYGSMKLVGAKFDTGALPRALSRLRNSLGNVHD